MAAKNRKKTTASKPKGKFKIELGFTKALSVGAIVILAMIWSFILGVFIGRGYNPEDVIPDISRIMPEISQDRPVSRVLKPEELEFMDRLRSGSTAKPAPSGQQVAVKSTPDPVIQAPPAATPPPTPAPALEKFTYTYQVGSFQTIQRAGELQEQLMNDGFRASITDAFIGAEPWYRVIVEFQSSEQESKSMIRKLEKHGIHEPLLRSKRPS
ncbi:MAG: SPOR domain-containing protein [Desulfonatronovibrio sp. MSAO_Bac4]|nr:MAG: SPOR domain-containing protein [Desulfonatronovibrio sp. MSAO_Bac4]